jgi:hypothetical protein
MIVMGTFDWTLPCLGRRWFPPKSGGLKDELMQRRIHHLSIARQLHPIPCILEDWLKI